ncbi:hypothetical protein FQA39_LY18649 [Lamprigera yunnana]|nr:hypothetical protein FQA39_LY18649 [Lamprigera yunnana]
MRPAQLPPATAARKQNRAPEFCTSGAAAEASLAGVGLPAPMTPMAARGRRFAAQARYIPEAGCCPAPLQPLRLPTAVLAGGPGGAGAAHDVGATFGHRCTPRRAADVARISPAASGVAHCWLWRVECGGWRHWPRHGFEVVEPTAAALERCFCVVWDGQALHGLNASGRAPAGWTPGYFDQLSTSGVPGTIPEKGWNAVTVPGAVSAWVELSKRFGKLPLAQVAEPAIGYARHGFAVSATIARLWALGLAKLGDQPGFKECFAPEGRAPQAGEWFKASPCKALEEIAATLGESFYRGALARKMVATAGANGGVMSCKTWPPPMRLGGHGGPAVWRFGGARDSAQRPGHCCADGAGHAGRDRHRQRRLNSVDTVHLQIEAMKLALADLAQYNADADHMRVKPQEELLNPRYLAQRAA